MFLRRATTIVTSNIDLEKSDALKDESDENIRLLLCSICKNVLVRPLVCSSCQTASCEMCLTEWGLKHPRCPSGCADFKYIQPTKFLGKFLKKLKIKCENHMHGCHKVLKYDEVEAHHHSCKYAVIHCKNQGCNFSASRDELEAHEEECDYEKNI